MQKKRRLWTRPDVQPWRRSRSRPSGGQQLLATLDREAAKQAERLDWMLRKEWNYAQRCQSLRS